ncbi:hypothetical protein ALQ33_00633 [Pseudomonas syringae pv. philadelphi]|uniref:Uncharacterized protein n=1 Tax=Pseudomonas syringae pv. philadelphi TaxID=251706 RepID=A0A3M3YZE2_9PSED|nr:hypothetical protein [Pseudomonas syringae group genomosp. 3]RMO87591.1 hypothetical protein ALQ33_00633 [Pseudomonas syringae pv. philadelphi]
MRSSADGKTPQEVIDASRTDFGVAVTGYLHQAEMEGFSLVGRIYFDHKDRFRNGRLIRTSDVSEFRERHGLLLAVTLTQSVYVLICPDSFCLGYPRGTKMHAVRTAESSLRIMIV